MEKGEKKKEMKLNIQADKAVLSGAYANNLMVHMNREEFVLDFLNVVPPHATLNSRIVLSPTHVKRMVKILQGTLERYEKEFGTLPEPSAQPTGKAEFVQ